MIGQVLRRTVSNEFGCDDAFGIVGYKNGLRCVRDCVAQLVEKFACDGMGNFLCRCASFVVVVGIACVP